MPVSTQTRAVSPVTLARQSARARLLRRVVALGALGLFVAGMLVAAGFGAFVVTALPFVVAAVIAAGAVWLLRRSRPWRIARPVARGVAHATASVARPAARLAHTGGSSAVATANAAPSALRAAAVGLREFLERPREPWRPPPALERGRSSLTALVVRTTPVRREAHRMWRALAAAGTARALSLAAGLERRIVQAAATRRGDPPRTPGA
jgi:hypothetical protein